MSDVICSMRCDWCDGELEFFPQAKSGLRCRSCWRTEGNDDGEFSIKNRAKRFAEQLKKQKGGN